MEVIGSHPVKFVNPQQVQYEKTYVNYYSDRSLDNKVDFHIIWHTSQSINLFIFTLLFLILIQLLTQSPYWSYLFD